MGATFSNLQVHLIFATKERRPLITPELQSRMYEYIGGIVRGQGGSLLAIGGTPDHVHLLVRYPPDCAIASLMREVKSESSRWVHDTFPGHRHFQWQRGYGAFSVSESQSERVRRYVENQPAHHAKKSFRREFAEFLRRHRIAFEERFLS